VANKQSFVELGDSEMALVDINALTSNPDVVLIEEIVEGCPTTRLSGAELGIKLYQHLGDTKKVKEYQSLKTKFLSDMDSLKLDGAKLKEAGNALFNKGQLDQALQKYRESISKDPFQPTTWGNMCQVFMKKQQWPQAIEAADRSIKLKPDWPKGWYRKAACLLSMNQLPAAFAVLGEGLKNCTTDQDLKDKYLEVGKKIQAAEDEEVKKVSNKSLVGILTALSKPPWDARKWHEVNKLNVQYWKPDQQWKDLQGQLENPLFKEGVQKVMATRYPDFQQDMVPAECDGVRFDGMFSNLIRWRLKRILWMPISF
jgi:tetratricopeptide (TPR) repeat protein